jgi:hypothetical protein
MKNREDDFNSGYIVDRRKFASTLLGGAALSLGANLKMPGNAQAAAAGSSLDFQNPEDSLRAYVKLIGDLSGEPVIGTYYGHVFGVVGKDTLKPLFGFHGFGLGRFLEQPDGSFRQLWKEVGYYKDIETGAILQTWENPYTNEKVEPLPVQNDKVNFVLTTKTPQLPEVPGLDFVFGNYGQGDDFVIPWMIDRSGDWASCLYDVHGSRPNHLPPSDWPRASSGEFMRVSECFQYGGALSQIENPDVSSVRQVGGWQRIADWLPWMLNGQKDGHLFYRCVTRNLDRIEELPQDILDHTEKNFPDFLEPPTEWSFENVSSFDVYKRERKPILD